MAATSIHSGWSAPARKRDREDDYEDIALGGTLGFTEHRSKRLHSLPLRTSPSSKRPSGPPGYPPSHPTLPSFGKPQSITPTNSDSEDPSRQRQQQQHQFYNAQGSSALAGWPGPTISSAAQRSSEFETAASGSADPDADMMDTSEPALEAAPNHSYAQSARLEPGSLQPDPISPSINSRMPTPIHCSFAAQVRGNNWGGAAGHIAHTTGPVHQGGGGPTHREPYGEDESGIFGQQAVPRSLDGPGAAAAVMADWTLVQNRRLPSPISENGAEDGSESVQGSPGMVLDSSVERVNCHGHRHPYLASLPPRATSAMEIGSSSSATNALPRVDTPAVSPEAHEGSAMDVEPPTTPSPRKGHTRSRHTLNSWTIQPGMKKSFSIGYRADCEKCRMKVPGHFNHIVIS